MNLFLGPQRQGQDLPAYSARLLGYVKPIALKFKINAEIDILHIVNTIFNHKFHPLE